MMNRSFLSICSIALALFSCKKDNGPAPIANFSVNATNLRAPSRVSFTNASTNAISYSWEFGDGSNADIYFKITDGSSILNNYSANKFDNPASLPVQWNFPTPYVVSPLQTERRFELWDYDSALSSEFMGLVNFIPSLLQSNTASPYPDKTTLTNLGLTVELGLLWE